MGISEWEWREEERKNEELWNDDVNNNGACSCGPSCEGGHCCDCHKGSKVFIDLSKDDVIANAIYDSVVKDLDDFDAAYLGVRKEGLRDEGLREGLMKWTSTATSADLAMYRLK
jgi:hypothetical protein